VILIGHVGKGRPFASLFTVEEGRITFVKDFEDDEALEATLVSASAAPHGRVIRTLSGYESDNCQG
jgi:hypothetical protein